MRAVAILNAKAGLCLQHGEGIERQVADAFRSAGTSIEVTCIEPQQIEAAIEQAAARTDIDTLIIGGGDGTQSLAASKLMGKDIALGILPFGTVNLLGRDLNVPLEIEDAAKALPDAERIQIDLAEVNGRIFHSLLGLGFFAKLAGERQRAREQIPFARALAFAVAVTRSVLRVGGIEVAFEADGGARKVRHSSAVLVTNNRYRESPLHRARIDEGLLEINIVRGGHAAALLKAGFDLVAGRWRREDSTEQVAVREVTITTRRKHLHASVDGERVALTSPLTVKIRPKALTVLRPRG